jgi:hypothetical protein
MGHIGAVCAPLSHDQKRYSDGSIGNECSEDQIIPWKLTYRLTKKGMRIYHNG